MDKKSICEINLKPPAASPNQKKENITMNTNELKSTVKNLRKFKRTLEELQTEIASLEDQIKAQMGNCEEITAGEYKITYKRVKSSRLDSAALKKELPGIAQRYTIPTEYRGFAIV